MPIARSALFAGLLALLLAAAPAARADEKLITVYKKGQTLRYDADAGAELKEVILETYDCRTGKLAKKETLETYYHLSENGEIITPAQICDACYKVFKIEKKDDKYFFGGIRDTVASTEEAAAARKAAPPATSAEAANSLGEKVRKIAHEMQKLGGKAGPKAAEERTRLINSEFTTSLQGFDSQDLGKIAGFVTSDKTLSKTDQYIIVRAFGYAFYEKKDCPKAVFFYDKCIELLPDEYSAYFQRGLAQAQADLVDDAVQSYAKALSLKPKNVAGFFESLVKDRTSTPRLDAQKMLDLKSKLAAVDAALQAKDDAKAKAQAGAVADAVTKWYAGGGPGTPPPGGN